KDAEPEVRRQAALALGEWGDERAAAALGRLLQTDPDEEVQLYCVGALGTIGGPTAVEALRKAIEQGTDPVRDEALEAIEDLATGGRKEDTEAPDRQGVSPGPEATMADSHRVRGAVRTRGRPRKASASKIVGTIAATLQHIRSDDTASEYL